MSVVMILVFVSFFEVGLGPIPWLIGAEIFPNRIRSEAMGISSTINWMSNFAVGLSFPSLSLALGPYSFVPFGLVLLVAFVLQYWFVPETQGKSLEEIQEEFLQQAGLDEERDEEEGRSSSVYGDATPSRLADDLSEADEDEEEDDDLLDTQQVSATDFHQSQRNGQQQRSYPQGSPQSAQGGGGDTPATPIPEESEERESQSGSGKD